MTTLAKRIRKLLRTIPRGVKEPHFEGNGGNADDAFEDGVKAGSAYACALLADRIEALLDAPGGEG